MQYTEVVTITPDMAREWLKMNIPNNRPLNRVRVRQYAADMRAGAWVLTHQGIAFSNRGLEDGQNRLAAIIEAGVPVTMNVTRGMEFRNDVLTVIDGGKKFSSVQLSSGAQSHLTLHDPMNHSTPGLPVHHHPHSSDLPCSTRR